MDKENLLRKLSVLLDQMEREHTFGAIEIEVRDGRPVVMRKIFTDKLVNTGENNRVRDYTR